MKKAISLMLSCLFLFGEGLGGVSAAAERITISVSVLPQAYFVERIAGMHARVSSMIPKAANHETYEPTPQRLVVLSDAQLYLKVGAPGFPFEEKYLKTVLGQNRRVRVINMSDGMTYRKEDLHVWTSPAAVRIAAENIRRALSACDPAHSAEYLRNLRLFLADIDQLDGEIKRALAGKKGFSFMVYHPAWGYFADEYGLHQLAIEADGKPASAAHIRRMVDLARDKGIRAILIEKGFDTKSARSIAHEIGGEIVEADPLERDWLAGMRHVTAILARVLKR